MFAVIETGGKQYLVKNGDFLRVEKLTEEQGTSVTFDKVLLTADEDGSNVKIGKPYLKDVKVVASVEKQGRAKKVRVVKYKRKVRYHKVYGHRQHFTQVKVDKIG